MLYVWYRPRLQIRPEARERVMDLDARRSIEDPEELKRALPVLLGTIMLFFVHKPLHLEPATVALAGASVANSLNFIKLNVDLAAASGWLERLVRCLS